MAHSNDHANHVTGPKTYAAVLGALLVLTIVTVQASYLDFGSMNTVVALLIATAKASLVALFFMHLRHDKKFNLVIFLLSFVFLALFLVYTLDDLSTRGRVDADNGVPVLPRTGEYAPGGMPSAGAMTVIQAPPALGGSALPAASAPAAHGAAAH